MSNNKALTIRADENLIKVFHHACSNTDITASQAIRGFMREYSRKHGQADLFASNSLSNDPIKRDKGKFSNKL